MGILPGKLDEVAPYMDKYDLAFFFIMFSIACLSLPPIDFSFLPRVAGLSFPPQAITPSHSLAFITASTAFVALYRLRKPDDADMISQVWQTFEPVEDGDYMDWGLRNHGSGCALHLQVRIEKASTDETVFSLKPKDDPIHLKSGEFLGFVHDDRITDTIELEDLRDDIEKGSKDQLNLYYSFRSSEGSRIPKDMDGELETIDQDILEILVNETDYPRDIEMSRVVENCSKETKATV